MRVTIVAACLVLAREPAAANPPPDPEPEPPCEPERVAPKMDDHASWIRVQ